MSNRFCAVHNETDAAVHHGNVKRLRRRDNRRLLKSCLHVSNPKRAMLNKIQSRPPRPTL
jgi:DNA-directed RNA polymerase specialized sigma54-like protein